MSRIKRRRAELCSGFTLMEVVISAALMAIIVAGAYLCLGAGFSTQEIIEPRVEVLQNARVAMTTLAADLRGACALSPDIPFLGMRRMFGDIQADNLDFGTHNYTPRRAHEGDFCQVSYYVDRDPETGAFALWRRRNPTIAPDPLSGGSRELIASGLLGVQFEYFDGLDWYDTWGEIRGGKEQTSNRDQPNLVGIPEAVRITLSFDSNPNPKKAPQTEENPERTVQPPFVFQTVARIALAARSLQEASSGNSSSDANSGSNGQPGSQTQGGSQ